MSVSQQTKEQERHLDDIITGIPNNCAYGRGSDQSLATQRES